MDTFLELIDLGFKFLVFIYITIVSIRVTLVGIYNATLGNDEYNPLRVEGIHYDPFFPIAWAFIEVLFIRWRIWHPEKMLYKVGDIVNDGKSKRTS